MAFFNLHAVFRARSTRGVWTRVPAVIAAGVLAMASCSGGDTPKEAGGSATPRNVILCVIDGPRSNEAFDDPVHRYVPNMWNSLRARGSIIPEFRNDGWTLTNPGHAAVLTGTWQEIANNGSERPTQPTLFEYYRKTRNAPQAETYLVGGKAKLNACAYSNHPDYGPAYGATAGADDIDDTSLYGRLISVLQAEKPRLVMVAFSDVDIKAHDNDWDGYIGALASVDSLIDELWTFLESDSFYAGTTYLIVTNDHGRHDDPHGGFQNHGDDCEGCRRIMFLALGPDIKPGYTATATYRQRDICNMVGRIFDFPVVYSDGVPIDEIFVNR